MTQTDDRSAQKAQAIATWRTKGFALTTALEALLAANDDVAAYRREQMAIFPELNFPILDVLPPILLKRTAVLIDCMDAAEDWKVDRGTGDTVRVLALQDYEPLGLQAGKVASVPAAQVKGLLAGGVAEIAIPPSN